MRSYDLKIAVWSTICLKRNWNAIVKVKRLIWEGKWKVKTRPLRWNV